MLQFFIHLLFADAHHAALGDQRLDHCHTQFHGFLQGKIHLVGLDDGLHQREVDGGFGVSGGIAVDQGGGSTFADAFQAGEVFAAFTVEQD